jgi:hypothetical protein
MSQVRLDEVARTLSNEGFTEEQTARVKAAITASLPERTYNTAVVYLGVATVALVLGSILLGGMGKDVPEALWGALGAGIGGLAGVFMGSRQ